MQTDGGKAEPHIPGFDRAAIDNFFSIDYADDESRDVVFTLSVKTRHLGGLAAQQHASVFAAAARDSLDHAANRFGRQFSCRDVIEKEKRPRALDQNVVDAVIDQVAP